MGVAVEDGDSGSRLNSVEEASGVGLALKIADSVLKVVVAVLDFDEVGVSLIPKPFQG